MRRLGSFNKLGPRKYSAADWTPKSGGPAAEDLKSNLGYLMGLHKNTYPYERPLQASTGPGIRGGSRGGPRMAGDAMQAFFSTGEEAAEPLPLEGNAELRTPYLQ